eukprot:3883918-Heterocapsa_arctica.AAC.1
MAPNGPLPRGTNSCRCRRSPGRGTCRRSPPCPERGPDRFLRPLVGRGGSFLSSIWSASNSVGGSLLRTCGSGLPTLAS